MDTTVKSVNMGAEDRPLAKERDERVVPIARRVLKAIAEREDLPMGSSASVNMDEKTAKYYADIYTTVVAPLLLEGDLLLTDVPFLFKLLRMPISLVSEITEASLENNRDLALGMLAGMDDIDDMKVSDVDRILKEYKSNAPVDNQSVDETADNDVQ